MICPFCGLDFTEKTGLTAGCRGCILRKSCTRLKCPCCGYELPRDTGLSRWLHQWLGGKKDAR